MIPDDLFRAGWQEYEINYNNVIKKTKRERRKKTKLFSSLAPSLPVRVSFPI